MKRLLFAALAAFFVSAHAQQQIETNQIEDAAVTFPKMGDVVDEDNMSSDSAVKIPTQQSVKAYVDANAGSHGNGANCSAGNYPLGVDASGVVESCTPDDDVPEAGDFSGTPDGTKFLRDDLSWQSVASGESTTVSDTAEIDHTLAGDDISSVLVAGSIDETKLDTSTNASLNLADSATQPGDNISTLTNNSGYLTTVDISDDTNLAGDSEVVLTGDALSLAASVARDSELHDELTLSGARDYITLTDQILSRGIIDVSDDTNLAGDSEIVLTGDTLSIASSLARDSELHAAATVTDSAEVDLTITGQDIEADIVTGSIDEAKLDTSTNASLDLADSALQSQSDVEALGFVTGAHTTDTFVTNKDAHDHSGGDGAQIDYTTLSSLPTIPSGNQIIDWTVNQGATDIHFGNYTDTNAESECSGTESLRGNGNCLDPAAGQADGNGIYDGSDSLSGTTVVTTGVNPFSIVNFNGQSLAVTTAGWLLSDLEGLEFGFDSAGFDLNFATGDDFSIDGDTGVTYELFGSRGPNAATKWTSIVASTGISISNSSDNINISTDDSEIDHDGLLNFSANEHIDWTASSAGTIHASNYTDTNTQLDQAGVEALGFVTGSHTVDTNTQLSNAQVETAYNTQVGQVSEGEKTAGTETSIRRFSPDDVKDMIDTHASADSSANIYVSVVRASGFSVPANTITKITGFTENEDVGDDFASDTFTAPQGGRYLLTGNIIFQTVADADRQRAYIYKNSAVLRTLYNQAGGTAFNGITVSMVVDLVSNDTIDFRVNNIDSADSLSTTHFDISYLGTGVYAGVDGALAVLKADTDVSGNSWVLDEDNLSSDSNTKLATQQSIKAYVDAFRPKMAMLGINSTSQSVNSTSRTELDFLENTGEYFVDSGITHSTSTNPERIQVAVDSRCEVSGGIGITGSTGNYRYQAVTSIAINGGAARDGYGDGYIRATSGANSTTVKVLDVFDISAGQYFTVGIARTNTTSGNATTEANKTKLLVKCWAD